MILNFNLGLYALAESLRAARVSGPYGHGGRSIHNQDPFSKVVSL